MHPKFTKILTAYCKWNILNHKVERFVQFVFLHLLHYYSLMNLLKDKKCKQIIFTLTVVLIRSITYYKIKENNLIQEFNLKKTKRRSLVKNKYIFFNH